MRRSLQLGCVALALALTGCATKSPPTGAEIRGQALTNVVMAASWKSGGAEGAIADDWLASFGDANLDALVREALTNNLDLKVTSAKLEQAAGYVDLAKGALRPSVNLFGTGGVNGGGGDMSQPLLGAMLGASWELDLWGRMRYARNAAQATHASAQADFQFARQSLGAAVAKAYFTATETHLQLAIAGATVRAGEDMAKVADKRASVGVGSDQDAALARANLGSFQDSLKQIQLAHANALRALELLLGRYPAAEVQARTDLPALPGPVPVGMPLDMLERRPDLIAAERRVAAAFNRVGEAKAARLPSIALNLSVAYLESDILQLNEDYENPSSGGGARLLAPIYKGGQLQSQVRIRSAEQKEAVAEYARIALRSIGDVESALATTQSLEEREKILRQVVTDNERALVLAEKSYKVGQQDLRSVLQQQITLQNAQLTLLRVQSEQLSQRANLHLALGGSFESPMAVASTEKK